jgi:hypothetical protein
VRARHVARVSKTFCGHRLVYKKLIYEGGSKECGGGGWFL